MYGPHLVNTGADTSAPNDMAGIYLPLLWGPEQPEEKAVREPISLLYDAGHFWSLVPLDAVSSARVPLVACDGTPLPVKCLLEHEDRQLQIERWMDCGALNTRDPIDEGLKKDILPFAITSRYNPHPHLGPLVSAFVQQVVGTTC